MAWIHRKEVVSADEALLTELQQLRHVIIDVLAQTPSRTYTLNRRDIRIVLHSSVEGDKIAISLSRTTTCELQGTCKLTEEYFLAEDGLNVVIQDRVPSVTGIGTRLLESAYLDRQPHDEMVWRELPAQLAQIRTWIIAATQVDQEASA